MTRRSNSIRANNVRRALGIFDPHAHAIGRVTTILEHGFAVDSRRRPDGTWNHRRADKPARKAASQ